jgi:hypothetical protein
MDNMDWANAWMLAAVILFSTGHLYAGGVSLVVSVIHTRFN